MDKLYLLVDGMGYVSIELLDGRTPKDIRLENAGTDNKVYFGLTMVKKLAEDGISMDMIEEMAE